MFDLIRAHFICIALAHTQNTIGFMIRATADNKMAAKRQSFSSNFLVNLLWIKITEKTREHDISSSVMNVLLRTFELHPNDAAIARVAGNVEDTLNKEFKDTLRVDFRVRILSKGKAGKHLRKEQNKIVLIKLSDEGEGSTVMVFRVINRNNVLSLRSQAAAKVARCFQNQKVMFPEMLLKIFMKFWMTFQMLTPLLSISLNKTVVLDALL